MAKDRVTPLPGNQKVEAESWEDNIPDGSLYLAVSTYVAALNKARKELRIKSYNSGRTVEMAFDDGSRMVYTIEADKEHMDLETILSKKGTKDKEAEAAIAQITKDSRPIAMEYLFFVPVHDKTHAVFLAEHGKFNPEKYCTINSRVKSTLPDWSSIIQNISAIEKTYKRLQTEKQQEVEIKVDDDSVPIVLNFPPLEAEEDEPAVKAPKSSRTAALADIASITDEKHAVFSGENRIMRAVVESMDDITALEYDRLLVIPSRDVAYDAGNKNGIESYLKFTERPLTFEEKSQLEWRLANAYTDEEVPTNIAKSGMLCLQIARYCMNNDQNITAYDTRDQPADKLAELLPAEGAVAVHTKDPEVVKALVNGLIQKRSMPVPRMIDADNYAISPSDKLRVHFIGDEAKIAFYDYVTSTKNLEEWVLADEFIDTLGGY